MQCPTEEQFDRVYQAQYDLILARFGQEAADQANYGCGVDQTNDTTVIETKVYGADPHVLTSITAYPYEHIEHTFTKYLPSFPASAGTSPMHEYAAELMERLGDAHERQLSHDQVAQRFVADFGEDAHGQARWLLNRMVNYLKQHDQTQ